MTIEKPQLLLIEDDVVDRELLRRLLHQEYEISEAANGKEGVAAIASVRPQLVLLDYHLPDVDSFDLLSQFVTDGVAVIVLTGEESPHIIVKAMQQGAEDYLLKERLTKEALQRAITNALEKSALKRSVQEQQRQLSIQADVLANQNRQIRTLASALTLAEQRERKRVAQMVHDHVQQLLYGVQMRMHLVAEDLPPETPDSLQDNLAEAKKLLEEVIGAARSLSVELSPPVLKNDGISTALEWLSTHMRQVHGLQVDLQVSEDYNYRVESEELHVLIFQLVRELLFNVVKHANVREARVHLFSEDGYHKIAVEDEGAGFEAGKIVQPKWKPEQGYGLYSVRERLALFGGCLQIDSHPGNGARATITLPSELVQE